MTTLLPPSEPADPVQGQPGHFAWSNWIKQAVKNLDAGTLHIHEVSGRNRIINGDFSVNQRSFTSMSPTAGACGIDRWAAFFSGGTVTYSAQTPALGELPESAARFARLATSGQSAASDRSFWFQNIESVRTLSGKTATVSFWAKAASGTPRMAIVLNQSFGAGGSTGVDTPVGQVTLSTAWVRYSVTASLPSIAGKTIGTDSKDCLCLYFYTSAGTNYNAVTGSLGTQSNTIDLWGVQVEEGSIATAYEQKTYAEELRACQRHFWRVVPGTAYGKYGAGVVSNTNTAYAVIQFPVAMRAVPTLSKSGNVAVYDGTTATTASSIVLDAASPQTTGILVNGSGWIIGRGALFQNNNDVNAYIDFSADL